MAVNDTTLVDESRVSSWRARYNLTVVTTSGYSLVEGGMGRGVTVAGFEDAVGVGNTIVVTDVTVSNARTVAAAVCFGASNTAKVALAALEVDVVVGRDTATLVLEHAGISTIVVITTNNFRIRFMLN